MWRKNMPFGSSELAGNWCSADSCAQKCHRNFCYFSNCGCPRKSGNSVCDPAKKSGMDRHVLDPGGTAKSEGRPSDNSVDRLCWSQLRVTMFAVILHGLCSDLSLHWLVSASHPGQMSDVT